MNVFGRYCRVNAGISTTEPKQLPNDYYHFFNVNGIDDAGEKSNGNDNGGNDNNESNNSEDL